MTTIDAAVGRAEFDELFEAHRSWGIWGPDDDTGALNHVTGEAVAAACRSVRSGKVFSLAIAMDDNGPLADLPPRRNPSHVMYRDGGDIALAHAAGERGYMSTDDAVYMALQCATQWDSLAHPFYDARMYNGHGPEQVPSSGAKRNSIAAATDRMVGRGVLLDVPRALGRRWLERGEAVEADDLERCCAAQGVEVREGDFVLVRTGRMGAVRERGTWQDEYAGGVGCGLGVSVARFLCPRKVAAVAVDTFSADVIPNQTRAAGIRCPVHVILTVGAGIHLGEDWQLEELADDCASDGVYEFLLVAQPLPITGAVGSPVNPQAIK
jgi:kynurenine formamidase